MEEANKVKDEKDVEEEKEVEEKIDLEEEQMAKNRVVGNEGCMIRWEEVQID